MILLGKNKHDGFWSDWGQRATQGQRGNQVAEQALSTQTGQQYTTSTAGSPWRRIEPRGDIVHFIQVAYTPGRQLYNPVIRAGYKTDVMWVPENQLLGQGNVSLKGANVSNGFLQIFRSQWPSVKQQFTAPRPVQTVQPQIQPTPCPVQPRQAPIPTVGGGQSTAQRTNGWLSIPNAIRFYNRGARYYEFTNFYSAPFSLDGHNWKTSEQYYQAQKFQKGSRSYNQILAANTPREAFTIAQQNRNAVHSNWRQISIPTMVKAVRAKFSQNTNLKNMLLNTGNKVLIEDAGAKDAFYGAGADGKGQNQLGQILMHVRQELRSGAQSPYVSKSWSQY